MAWIVIACLIVIFWFLWPTIKKSFGHSALPIPRWKPAIPINIEKIVVVFSRCLEQKKAFIVFKNGTCVFTKDRNSPLYEDEAKHILRKIYDYHPDFSTIALDDGNWLVKYNEPLASIVLKEEIDNYWCEIENHYQKGITSYEVLVDEYGNQREITKDGKIGLFARARMFMDAQNPQVAKIWKPENQR